MSKYLELVEGSFTQEHLNKQKSQKPYVAYSIQDGKVIYTIVPKDSEDMWIISTIELKDISNLTYNEVDLGKAGIWADRNVGASSPEDFGSYFQWGDTNAYTYVESAEITTEQLVDLLNPLIGPGITVDNVKDILASEGITGNDLRDVLKAVGINTVIINKEFNWNSYFDTTDGGSTFNKYNNNGGLIALESVDDAATIHIGSNWSIPSNSDLFNLIQNTTHTCIDIFDNEYSDINQVDGTTIKGFKFTAENGNSIFLPTAGIVIEYTHMYSENGSEHRFGQYWTRDLNDGIDSLAYTLPIMKSRVGVDLDPRQGRCLGLSIRAIKKS